MANMGGNARASQAITSRVPVDQREGRTELDRYLPQSDVLQELFLPELETLRRASPACAARGRIE